MCARGIASSETICGEGVAKEVVLAHVLIFNEAILPLNNNLQIGLMANVGEGSRGADRQDHSTTTIESRQSLIDRLAAAGPSGCRSRPRWVENPAGFKNSLKIVACYFYSGFNSERTAYENRRN